MSSHQESRVYQINHVKLFSYFHDALTTLGGQIDYSVLNTGDIGAFFGGCLPGFNLEAHVHIEPQSKNETVVTMKCKVGRGAFIDWGKSKPLAEKIFACVDYIIQRKEVGESIKPAK